MPAAQRNITINDKPVQRVMSFVLDLLFPPRCAGCGRVDTMLCRDCQSAFELIQAPICPRCGQPQPAETVCKRCTIVQPLYHTARSQYLYSGPLRRAIHALKYDGRRELSDTLAGMMLELVNSVAADQSVVLCAAPMHTARLRERGFNHAEDLVQSLCRQGGHTALPADALMRIRDTPTQVGLDLQARQENVRDAFRAKAELVHGQSVLLIDDVFTTGSTMDACARALAEGGAVSINAVTLARAQGSHQA